MQIHGDTDKLLPRPNYFNSNRVIAGDLNTTRYYTIEYF